MSSSSAPLSDSDAAFLYRYGNDIAEDSADFITETGLVALYGIIFTFAMHSFFRKGVKTPAAFIMVCVVIYLYAAATILWVLNVVEFYKSVHLFLMDTTNTPLPDRGALVDEKTATLSIARDSLFMFSMIVGDSVLVWRVWVIFFSHTMGLFVSLRDVVHLVWEHRQMGRRLQLRKSTTDRILSLLVESGFIYCLLWVPQLIPYLDAPHTNYGLYYATMVIDAFGTQLSGMYPTLIIVIVNLRYTIQWEEADSIGTIPTTRGGERDNVSTMRFASSPSSTQHRDPRIVTSVGRYH
ncbi:hypothetical protein B0H19DRAFT_1375317 [Mycena capillaripes]|nr:hypothetical protein B0H19DRAFT_1375317 [Mycena capillaripes]